MREDFDPFAMAPQDDEEAIAALKYSKGELFGANLCKLYQINREEGAGVVDAFEKALLAGVEPGERQDAKTNRAIQWLEINLLKFAEQCGADVGNTSAHRTAVHLLSGLGHNHTDAIVEVAREKWDIEYSRARK